MPDPHQIFLVLLTKKFHQLKAKNPRYSLRAFALKLGLSVGTLSEVMRGKFRLKPARMEEVMAHLDLSERERNRMLVLLGKSAQYPKFLISPEAAEYLSDWKNRAILHSFDLEPESPTVADVSQRLKIPVKDIKVCHQRLFDLGLLAKDTNGNLYRPSKVWQTSDGNSDESVRKTHLSNFSLGEKAFASLPLSERDFTSMMFTGSKAQFENLRKEIRKVYEKVLCTMEEGDRDELFQVSISAYPINFESTK